MITHGDQSSIVPKIWVGSGVRADGLACPCWVVFGEPLSRGPRSLGSATPSAMVRATLRPFVLLFFALLFIFAIRSFFRLVERRCLNWFSPRVPSWDCTIPARRQLRPSGDRPSFPTTNRLLARRFPPVVEGEETVRLLKR